MRYLLYLALVLAPYPAAAQSTENRPAPEAPGQHQESVNVGEGREFMAATANPHASRAAFEILAQGGSAADAAIAAQLVLSLVEPQSSGIGGGAFALYWNAAQKRLHAYNGRETAPSGMRQEHFLSPEGERMSYWDTVLGGYAVGVPGVPALLEHLHKKHGRIAWKKLFAPAIRLATEGFEVSPRLNLLLRLVPHMDRHPSLRDYFFDAQGQPLAVGHLLKSPDYARTLQQFAEQGGALFYSGAIAEDIERAVREDPLRPGLLRLRDLRDYRLLEQKPLCGNFREYQICGAPPPSSGGSTILAILGMLQNLDSARLPAADPLRLHWFAESARLAFADRNAYLGDPDFVAVPVAALLDPDYLRSRSALISPHKAMPRVEPGAAPPFSRTVSISAQGEQPSTTHLSLIDRYGNIISMTSSIEGAFGSRILVRGFLLNHQLTDFDFVPTRETGELRPNRPQGGKRPLSSMAPTIVLRDGEPVLAIGSPGGKRIINYVARSIWLYMEEQGSLAEIFESGHVVHVGRESLELEQDAFDSTLHSALRSRGHQLAEHRHSSGLHAISIRSDGSLLGVADPRREGSVAGR